DVTRSRIAQMLSAEGKFDAALDMHLERLPIVQELGVLDGLAQLRFSCAQIRLKRGDHERGEIQTIHDELAEAYAIARHLQRSDFIGSIGSLHAQVLAMGRLFDEAIEVLHTATAAFDKIGQTQPAAHCRQLIETIKSRR
ncbi:MAG: hypothetical protein AAGI03_16425, partial [Pseudomonadota bacterium]